MMSVLEGVTEKQTKKGRLREFYRTTRLPTADKGEGIKTSTNFADVIYGSPLRRRKRNSGEFIKIGEAEKWR